MVYVLTILILTAQGSKDIVIAEPFPTAVKCAEAGLLAEEIYLPDAIVPIRWRCDEVPAHPN